MNSIKFSLAAKTDVGLHRSNNEDNFQVCSNLCFSPMKWVNNEVCQLGEKGALLVVADGMGGMNAGEVASQIAIDTIRNEFLPERLTSSVLESRYSIERFMCQAIIKADSNIKETSAQKPETQGMGTTIVMAWLYKEYIYVAWCGDSRAYIYNPTTGLHRLSKDHSYVQQLVDAGKLSEEEAFDLPDSNIITRCLSDARQKAEPEVIFTPYKMCNNDILLLCTDGLCGMIRDHEIESVIQSEQKDMNRLTDMLVQAALKASGADNVTVAICRIVDGGAKSNVSYFDRKNQGSESKPKLWNKKGIRYSIIGITCLLCVLLGVFISYHFFNSPKPGSGADTSRDSLSIEVNIENTQSPQNKSISSESADIEFHNGVIGTKSHEEKAPSSIGTPNLNGLSIHSKEEESEDEELTPNVSITDSKDGEETEPTDEGLTLNKKLNPTNPQK